MTTVRLKPKNDIRVKVESSAGLLKSNNPVTIKNSPVGATGRLDSLGDVVASGETNGATLVYDASTDRYVVQKLDLSNVSGDLDGGTF